MLRQFSNHQSLITVFIGLVMWLWGANLYAQPDTLWTRTFGGTEDEGGYSVQQTTDGGYIIAGYTCSYGAGAADVWLIKTDSNGDTLWTKTFGGSGTDKGYSVQQTIDGGYIVVGETNSYGAGYYDVWLIKTDSDGEVLWTETFGGPNWDRGECVQETSDSGYIVVGWTHSFGAGDADVWLIKTDSNGDTLWTKTFGKAHWEGGYSVQQTTDGGYIVSGSTNSFGAGADDVWLIKTNSNGDTLWTKTFGGYLSDFGRSVQQTSDGGYIVAGWTGTYDAAGDFYLIKTDSLGDTLWTRVYGGTDADRGYSVRQTADGGYIVTGYTLSYGPGGYDVWIIKTDSMGDTVWTSAYGTVVAPYNDIGYSVRQTTDGGYIVAGYAEIYGPEARQVWLIKIAPEVGIEESVKSKDARFLLNYPNPFTGVAEIGYGLPEDTRVIISIYNCLGQKVATIVDAKKSRGYHTANWDAKKMSAGVYFIKLKVEDYTETEKIVLLR